MAIQIALEWTDECEKELIKEGFEKKEVYVRSVPTAGNTDQQVRAGDKFFFSMQHKPLQFVTTSWWGATID